MDNQILRTNRVSLRWVVFLAVLGCLAVWAPRSVLVRAHQLSTADTSVSTFASFPPGSSAKAVVRLESVKGKELKGTLQEKQSDTVYQLATDNTPTVVAVLSTDTSVAMKGAGWGEVFGPDADVFFHAWAVARYVGHIARAGKIAYPFGYHLKPCLFVVI